MPLLYFVWPQNGTTIKGGFWCRFGLRNMGVTHAGDISQNSGHHHLLVDVNEPLNPNEPIPQDKSHLHFRRGPDRKRAIELPPGKHTLQLVLGDADHLSVQSSGGLAENYHHGEIERNSHRSLFNSAISGVLRSHRAAPASPA